MPGTMHGRYIRSRSTNKLSAASQSHHGLSDGAPTPTVMFTSDGTWMVIMQRNAFMSIEDLAQPELRIAGLRINPKSLRAAESRL